MYSDEEAYEVMRQFVLKGNYKKAYEFCTKYKCTDNALKTSLECAKDILQFINEHSGYVTHFYFDDVSIHNEQNQFLSIKHRLEEKLMIYQINELRTLFEVNNN